MSVDYNRIMRVEAQIESSVLQQMEQSGGVYLPHDTVMGRRVFFAIDNVDFSEENPDGKRIYNGTALAVYQKVEAQDKVSSVTIDFTLDIAWLLGREFTRVQEEDTQGTEADAVLQLIKCGCAKEKCATNRCQCRKVGLSCTDLCKCMDREDDEDKGHNRGQKEDESDESDEEDEEDDVDDDDD
eukprot:gene2638-838_t